MHTFCDAVFTKFGVRLLAKAKSAAGKMVHLEAALFFKWLFVDMDAPKAAVLVAAEEISSRRKGATASELYFGNLLDCRDFRKNPAVHASMGRFAEWLLTELPTECSTVNDVGKAIDKMFALLAGA
jgi:hypothetical protein